MSHTDWRPHRDAQHAVDDLLDAAGQAFAQFGVARATMQDVARLAGCSRATLYRYFPNRDALHLGFVHRATLRIASRMAPLYAGAEPEVLVERIMSGIAAVRADPLLAVWFEPENLAVPIAVSQNSELLRAMTAAMVDNSGDVEETERRGAWLLRCIISFLAMPGETEAAERVLLQTYVVPLFTPDPDRQRK